MAAQQSAWASPELRKAPLSPRYRWNYTTPGGHGSGRNAAHHHYRLIMKQITACMDVDMLSRLKSQGQGY